jgi:phospholipase A1
MTHRCITGLIALALSSPLLAADDQQTSPYCRTSDASMLTHFWELSDTADCDTFGLRGYRPISLMGSFSDGVNRQPNSPAANHSALTLEPYQTSELMVQLSVRTKLAKGLLPSPEGTTDGLWFGYTQKSFWQVFNNSLSRPFRTTDHQPEFIYAYPLETAVGDRWTLRYAGVSLSHQSNGQAEPLSRSWNRVILLAGMDNAAGTQINVRAWQRMPESIDNDDNPDIADYIGRAEVSSLWSINEKHNLGLTVRHNLRRSGRGSGTLDWTIKPRTALNNPNAGLRYHVQLFSGYGDSLASYNFRRTAVRIGVSLVDW